MSKDNRRYKPKRCCHRVRTYHRIRYGRLEKVREHTRCCGKAF